MERIPPTSPSPRGSLASTRRALLRLSELSSGLVLISESDHPLRVVRIGRIAENELPSAVCALAARVGVPVQTVALEAFFERATRAQAYHTAADRVVVERYRALVRLFSSELANAQVYRAGAIEVDVYALGQSLEGEWLGVATKLIET